jgi:queuine tRNA-ribosyltransferase
LHHLFRANELLGHRLATIHNLTYCLDVVADMRVALRQGTFERMRSRWSTWGKDQDRSQA